MKNKYISIVVVIMLFIGFILFQGKFNKEDSIKIGAVYPLSGQFSLYGVEYKRGVELALGEINSSGGVKGRKLKVIFEDDSGDVKKSVSAIQKLINVDQVKYVLTAFSSASLATAPIAEEKHIVFIAATVSKLGTGNYVFRDCWDIEETGKSIGRSLNKDGMKKVGIIAVNYGDTDIYLKGLKSESSGSEFLIEMFNFGDTDFKTQLTKIKSFNPDAVVVYGFPGPEVINITKQFNVFGLDDKRLYAGATTYALPFIYEQFKETLIKMRVVDNNYDLDQNNKKAVEFRNNYKKVFGLDMTIADATYVYDDIYALKQALENSSDIENTKEVSDNLRKVKLSGAAGELTFDDMGNSKRDTFLQTFTETGWVKY